MTKKEIVKLISAQVKLSQAQTKQIVDLMFEAIVETLVADGRIELRNFGVFAVKTRKARTARNPLTEEEIRVEAKNVVTFQPGKVMEDRVRQTPPEFHARRRARKLPAAVAVGGRGEREEAEHDLPRKPR